MVCCDHQGTALPVPSYCLPWSSNPWVISCPITCTVLYSTVLYCTPVHPHHADGAEVEVARVAALEERGLEDTGREGCDDNIRRMYCTVQYRTALYLLMVLWLGEYQALTMAGCMSHTSRCGASLSVTRSCLAAQLRITTALLKKLSPSG